MSPVSVLVHVDALGPPPLTAHLRLPVRHAGGVIPPALILLDGGPTPLQRQSVAAVVVPLDHTPVVDVVDVVDVDAMVVVIIVGPPLVPPTLKVLTPVHRVEDVEVGEGIDIRAVVAPTEEGLHIGPTPRTAAAAAILLQRDLARQTHEMLLELLLLRCVVEL